jgi:hypothetical protein
MHEGLSREEKVRSLIGSVVATVGALVLGWVALPGGSTLLLAVYFGAAVLFGALAVSFLIALR